MIIPVKCFTCGKVIGDKYLLFTGSASSKSFVKYG